jgi:gag-polyprotein putative aspartyl protease
LHENTDSTQKHRKKCPLVNLTVNNNKLEALVDSGAELSCISQALYETLSQQNNIPTLPVTGITVVGATGSKTRNIKQQAFLSVNFGNDCYTEICFLVVDGLQVPMLLGADWLDETLAAIDFASKKLLITLGSCTHHIAMLTDDNNECYSHVNYIGVGIHYDREQMFSDKISCPRTRISNAIIIRRVMNVNMEKMQTYSAAQQSAEAPTPFKIRQLIKNNPDLNRVEKRKLAKILIKNIKAFSNAPGRVKDYEFKLIIISHLKLCNIPYLLLTRQPPTPK